MVIQNNFQRIQLGDGFKIMCNYLGYNQMTKILIENSSSLNFKIQNIIQ